MLYFAQSYNPLTMKRWFFRVFSAVVALGLIVLVLVQIEWAQFSAYLGKLTVWDALLFGVGYLCLNVFRTLRYRALLRGDVPLLQTFLISWFHNAMVRFLPFKLGEATYILEMNSRLSVSRSEGISSLFGARVLELLVVMVFAVGALFVAGEVLPQQSPLVPFFLLGLCVVGGASLYFSSDGVRLLAKVLGRWDAFSIRLLRLSDSLQYLRQPKPFAWALVYSLGTYTFSFLPNAYLLGAMGVNLPTLSLVLLVSLGMFATAFPFSLSGFGMVEASWAVGLVLLAGYSSGEATAIGLLLNMAQQISALIFGVIGWGMLQVLPHTPSTL